MERHKAILNIGAGAEFERGAEQHAHFALTDFGEQLLLSDLGVGIMDKGDFIGGNASGYELVLEMDHCGG